MSALQLGNNVRRYESSFKSPVAMQQRCRKALYEHIPALFKVRETTSADRVQETLSQLFNLAWFALEEKSGRKWGEWNR